MHSSRLHRPSMHTHTLIHEIAPHALSIQTTNDCKSRCVVPLFHISFVIVSVQCAVDIRNRIAFINIIPA